MQDRVEPTNSEKGGRRLADSIGLFTELALKELWEYLFPKI